MRLTDFGIAKKYSANNSNETSGTPGYMSPEVMKGTNHSFGVDFFAVGVIGYEFMLGKVIIANLNLETICWKNKKRH